jgi:hypothetical protein
MNNNSNRLKCAIVALSFFISSAVVQAASFTFNVDSTRGWQAASILVQRGQALSFSAVGAWNVDYRNFQYVGPDGYSPEVDSAIFQGCKLDQLLPYGRLLVRVGDDPSFWVIGSEGAFTADRDGVLAFRIHDGDACLGDNAGSVKVTVTSEQFPAAVQAPPPFYVCLSGPGSTCQGLYSNPVPDPGSPSLPPWFTSPKAGKCLLTIADKITNKLLLPELGFLNTFYTRAAEVGLPLDRELTQKEYLVYGLILVEAGSRYIVDRFGGQLAPEIRTELGILKVVEGCSDWAVLLQEELSRAR